MTRTSLTQRLILFCLLVAALAQLSLFAFPAAAQCDPGPCEPTSTPYPELNQPPASGPVWNGFIDGRIDPQLDDAYNIYCMDDQINVWGGKPEPRFITSFSLVDVITLPPDAITTLSKDGVEVSSTGEYIIVSGSNGNTTPRLGAKYFLLNDCIEANGGAPDIPPPPPPSNNQQDYQPPQDDTINNSADCIDHATSWQEFEICLNGDSSLQLLWQWISRLCLGGLGVGVAAYVPGARVRRKKKRQ